MLTDLGHIPLPPVARGQNYRRHLHAPGSVIDFFKIYLSALVSELSMLQLKKMHLPSSLNDCSVKL